MVPLHEVLASLQPFINAAQIYLEFVGATVVLAVALGWAGR